VIWFQVDDSICKFAKKGLTPSQIGVILRDSHGIAQVRSVTGNQILRILKAHGTCLFVIVGILLLICSCRQFCCFLKRDKIHVLILFGCWEM
jgi:hypothetical protein